MKKFINKIALGVSALAAAFMLFSCEPAEDPDVYDGNMIAFDGYNGYFKEGAFNVYVAESGPNGVPVSEYTYTYEGNELKLKLAKIYSISKDDANACGAKFATSDSSLETIMADYTKDTAYTPSAYLSLINTIEKSFTNASPNTNEAQQKGATITTLKKSAKKMMDGSEVKFRSTVTDGAVTLAAAPGNNNSLAFVDGVLFVGKTSELTGLVSETTTFSVTEIENSSGSGSTGGNSDPGTDPDPSSGDGD